MVNTQLLGQIINELRAQGTEETEKTERITIRVTKGEAEALRYAAARDHCSLSVFARRTLMDAADTIMFKDAKDYQLPGFVVHSDE